MKRSVIVLFAASFAVLGVIACNKEATNSGTTNTTGAAPQQPNNQGPVVDNPAGVNNAGFGTTTGSDMPMNHDGGHVNSGHDGGHVMSGHDGGHINSGHDGGHIMSGHDGGHVDPNRR